MPATTNEPNTFAPAEQYLRTLWDARLLYLAIVAVFVAGAVVITALLPRTYTSQAVLSVRRAPSLALAGLLYDSVSTSGRQVEEDAGRQELVPRRYLKRLQAVRTVTLAAQDAGIIDANTRLDERDIAKWVDADQVEKTDLVAMTVNQPTADAAQKFAARIVARTIESSRVENTSPETQQMLDAQVARAEKAMTAAEVRVAELDGSGGAPALKARRERAALELELARKSYVPLKRRLDVFELLLAEQQLQVYVVDPPTLPLRPSFPRPVLNVSIGLILGILAATLIVIVRGIFTAPVRAR